MPCYDDRDAKDRQTLVRLACKAMQYFEDNCMLDRFEKDELAWWKSHKEYDAWRKSKGLR
jgi:hypothetical protein